MPPLLRHYYALLRHYYVDLCYYPLLLISVSRTCRCSNLSHSAPVFCGRQDAKPIDMAEHPELLQNLIRAIDIPMCHKRVRDILPTVWIKAMH